MAELTQEQIGKELSEIEGELENRQTESVRVDGLSSAGIDLELEAINSELMNRGVEVEPIEESLTPLQAYERDKEFVGLATDPKTAELDFNEIRAYQPQVAKNEVVVGEGDNEYGFIDVMKDLKRWDKAVQVLGPVGATFDIGRYGRAVNSMKIANAEVGDFVEISLLQPFSGKLGTPLQVTQDLQDEANDFLIQFAQDVENKQNLTMGGKFANLLVQAPSFLIEFFLTRGAFTAGKKGAEKTMTKVLGEVAEKGAGRAARRAAAAGFGTLVRTGVNVPRVFADAGVKLTEGITTTDSGA